MLLSGAGRGTESLCRLVLTFRRRAVYYRQVGLYRLAPQLLLTAAWLIGRASCLCKALTAASSSAHHLSFMATVSGIALLAVSSQGGDLLSALCQAHECVVMNLHSSK